MSFFCFCQHAVNIIDVININRYILHIIDQTTRDAVYRQASKCITVHQDCETRPFVFSRYPPVFEAAIRYSRRGEKL